MTAKSSSPARVRSVTWRPRLAGALLAFLAATSLAFASPLQAAAAVDDPTPTPSPSSSTSAVPSITLGPLNEGIVAEGEALAASVAVTAGSVGSSAATLTLSVGTAPLSSAADVAAWLAGDADRAVTTLGEASVPALDADDRRVTTIRIDADDAVVSGLAPGVYPLQATVEFATTTSEATSVIVVPSSTDVDVAVVVPITAPALSTGLLTAGELSTLTSDDGQLSQTLAAIQGTNAILAIDPAIPAAIRALGTSAPESATRWLERLEALPNSRFALQFGDADPTAQIAAGLDAPLAPTSLTAYLNDADFADTSDPETESTASPTPTATATDAPTDDGVTLPSLEELLSIGGTTATVYWPDAVTNATAQTLSEATTPAAWTIASSSTVSAGGSHPVTARAGDAQLLLSDADASAALSAASLTDDVIDRAALLAEATALQALTVDAGADTVLLTIARADDRTALALRAAIDAATALPGATSLGLDELMSGEVATVTLHDQELSSARVDAVSELQRGASALADFATILDDPTLLTGPDRAESLQLLGLGWTDENAWADALADHVEGTRETVASVHLLPPSPIQLLAADAELPVGIRNGLPYPVTVILHAESDDIRLEVEPSSTVQIGAAQNVSATVPVQARVGSGTVEVSVSLTSPTGVDLGRSQMIEVNVHADWEGIGLIILGVLAGGFVALGLVRTVINLRKKSRKDDAE